MPGQLHPYTRPLVAVVPRSGSEFSTLFLLDFIYLLLEVFRKTNFNYNLLSKYNLSRGAGAGGALHSG